MSATKEEIVNSLKSGKSIKKIKEEKKIDEMVNKKEDNKKEEEKIVKKESKKAQIQIEGMPKNLKLDNGTVLLEFTPEMAEALVQGILEFIQMIAPDKFNNPTSQRVTMLKQPMFLVVQRWIPTFDILKYLPEIILVTGFIAAIKEMRKKEVTT